MTRLAHVLQNLVPSVGSCRAGHELNACHADAVGATSAFPVRASIRIFTVAWLDLSLRSPCIPKSAELAERGS
jgi:hypothetical protein